MKAFVFLCVVMAANGLKAGTAHLSQAQKEKAQQYGIECMKESKVKPELVADAKKGNFKDDEALKKFTLCFFNKSGIVGSDGKLNVDTALAKLPKDVDKVAVKKVLEDCRKKTGKDAADTAFETLKCYHKATPTHVVF